MKVIKMIKYLKINTLILLAWYGGLRWLLLAISNEASIDWLKDPISFFITIYSLIYLGFAYAILPNKQPKYFIGATIALFFANFYCLFEMTKLFIHETSIINFAYFMLDCFILSYYGVMWRFACLTVDNKTLCPFANMQFLK